MLQRKLEILKKECMRQYDFTPYTAFKCMDRYNTDRLDI